MQVLNGRSSRLHKKTSMPLIQPDHDAAYLCREQQVEKNRAEALRNQDGRLIAREHMAIKHVHAPVHQS